MKKQLDWSRIRFFCYAAILSCEGAFLAKPLMLENSEALSVIVTAYSILAGFLVGIITMIGDPKSLPSGSWQVARLSSEIIYRRLKRHKFLFTAYLATIALIFLSILLKKNNSDVNDFVEYIYLFLAIFCFLYSLKLPSTLMQLQEERIEEEIRARRKLEGIED
ncbi:hypothetical protein [Pseudomonas aeruginosa]|uniref:Uncharacterized protein n=1 Tax=Pseudomonas phage vB_Pae_BR319a TaxID=2563525 RepID=A0A481V8W6_9CAUD|nr:hypothetical protein [Pseudomonas aeruginosa]YP_010101763.1 hypothetical protein KNU51_gp29 [Pseudomonas phage vB_Pae_BR319a]MBG4396999.1 hypothetical protein [Pseudomonas aeruginosa]MCO1928770.1 hypothetical protein [Pseudomonas aeruginosa]MCV4129401.1 hypothetical protein [Pseudomonas aeruginosa]MDG4377780.1 hypothetical protein [Pseudomonas aeruginosa]MDH0165763.1 hypothetical protein [Pseudomonas aeruginosa]